jgi:hypothetical protein
VSDISPTRQRLRDLARREVAVFTPPTEDALAAVNLVPLGELAGPLFVALQDVLTVTEELREEASTAKEIDPALIGLQIAAATLSDHNVRITKRAAAECIEAAVLKALP